MNLVFTVLPCKRNTRASGTLEREEGASGEHRSAKRMSRPDRWCQRVWPGMRLAGVLEILGHSQISMTSRYAHVLPQVMTDAAERIGQARWG